MNTLDYAPPPQHTTTRARVSAAMTRAAIMWPTLVPPSLIAGMVVLRPLLEDGSSNAWERAAMCMTLPISLITFLALWRTLRVMRVLRRTGRVDAWTVSQIAVAVDVLVLVAIACVVLSW